MMAAAMAHAKSPANEPKARATCGAWPQLLHHSSTFPHAGVILPSPNPFLLHLLQVSAILDSLEVKAFQSNTNITQM